MNAKVSLKNFRGHEVIRENRETFSPRKKQYTVYKYKYIYIYFGKLELESSSYPFNKELTVPRLANKLHFLPHISVFEVCLRRARVVTHIGSVEPFATAIKLRSRDQDGISYTSKDQGRKNYASKDQGGK